MIAIDRLKPLRRTVHDVSAEQIGRQLALDLQIFGVVLAVGRRKHAMQIGMIQFPNPLRRVGRQRAIRRHQADVQPRDRQIEIVRVAGMSCTRMGLSGHDASSPVPGGSVTVEPKRSVRRPPDARLSHPRRNETTGTSSNDRHGPGCISP